MNPFGLNAWLFLNNLQYETRLTSAVFEVIDNTFTLFSLLSQFCENFFSAFGGNNSYKKNRCIFLFCHSIPINH